MVAIMAGMGRRSKPIDGFSREPWRLRANASPSSCGGPPIRPPAGAGLAPLQRRWSASEFLRAATRCGSTAIIDHAGDASNDRTPQGADQPGSALLAFGNAVPRNAIRRRNRKNCKDPEVRPVLRPRYQG
jgi:hypothetical protein